ncbi:ABC transporter substrate-binding protein [Crossiella cryophila]|uniref:Iron complex transport system substrate-binding protein n=1 Tax=Crossiella cryophila TaxID=43355 RepID=A0A7W7CDC2_9PSEU|nr:ABC transporter substrate-binding protein [Crossiella cryophila]MBB4679020.1 iron complex transport system substrate-binding protein [Crossiella cryophila]
MSRPIPLLIGAVALLALPACGGGPAAQPGAGTISITNCGSQVSFPAPAKRLFVNDGNLIAMTLALGAQEQIAAVSSVQRDAPTLKRHYGDLVDKLNSVSPEYPARETVLAQRPDVMVAGWSYGYAEEKQLTPATLRQQNVAAYVLTESCRQADGKAARGVIEPWQALREDLANLGKITGRTAEADKVTADLDARLKTLREAPKPAKAPTVFLFDSGTDSVYSSGRFGAPEAIISDAGARNALADVDDTWTKVSWERVAAARPDAFLFVDYPPQSYADKVALLKARAGINELPAVKENRFLNLPYALWTSGPLNIDAAEQVRKALEGWQLVPASTVTPKFDDRPGN